MNTGVKVNDRVVDQAEIQVQRFFTIALFLTAFVLDRWELVAAQSVIFGLTFLNPGFSPYIALYRHILRPAGLIRPDRRLDNPEPHRFATMIGLLVSSTAAYLLPVQYPTIFFWRPRPGKRPAYWRIFKETFHTKSIEHVIHKTPGAPAGKCNAGQNDDQPHQTPTNRRVSCCQ